MELCDYRFTYHISGKKLVNDGLICIFCIVNYYYWHIYLQKHNGAFNRIVSAYRTHMSRGTNGEMQSQHFKLFLSYILDNSVEWV